MGRRGKPVSIDLRRAILRMSTKLPLDEIQGYANVSRATILRILCLFKRTGDVIRTAEDHERRGRKRKIRNEDLLVSMIVFWLKLVTMAP